MLVLALELTDDLDLTALATVGLALLTVALAVIGGRALTQTRQGLDLTRQEVEAAQRPVVVMKAWDVEPKSGPKLNPEIYVTVRNVGAGVALDVSARLWARASGDHTESVATGTFSLGASEEDQVIFLRGFVDTAIGRDADVVLYLSYRDVAGQPWYTRAHLGGLDDTTRLLSRQWVQTTTDRGEITFSPGPGTETKS